MPQKGIKEFAATVYLNTLQVGAKSEKPTDLESIPEPVDLESILTLLKIIGETAGDKGLADIAERAAKTDPSLNLTSAKGTTRVTESAQLGEIARINKAERYAREKLIDILERDVLPNLSEGKKNDLRARVNTFKKESADFIFAGALAEIQPLLRKAAADIFVAAMTNTVETDSASTSALPESHGKALNAIEPKEIDAQINELYVYLSQNGTQLNVNDKKFKEQYDGLMNAITNISKALEAMSAKEEAGEVTEAQRKLEALTTQERTR